MRLCRRYRRLIWARKVTSVATPAIARELVGFVWAIARQVQPNCN
jgi:transposase